MRAAWAGLLAAAACARPPASVLPADALDGPPAVRTCVGRPVRSLGHNPEPRYPAQLGQPPTGPSGTAGPAYPGEVVAEFWIRPDGRVDTASVRIVRSTHPAFAEAVREVLPRHRFIPATASAAASDEETADGGPPCRPGVPGTPVWIEVQQTFNFRPDPLPARGWEW